MFRGHAGVCEANVGHLWLTPSLIFLCVIVTACGKAEIDVSQISIGNSVNKYAALVNKHAAIMREGGALVTGNQFNLELIDDIRTFVELVTSKGIDLMAPIGDNQALVDLAK
jgi:hypothetical protein